MTEYQFADFVEVCTGRDRDVHGCALLTTGREDTRELNLWQLSIRRGQRGGHNENKEGAEERAVHSLLLSKRCHWLCQ